MGLLTKEQILNAKDIETEEVEVKEWDGSVLVKGLSALERDKWEASVFKQKGKNSEMNWINARAKLVKLTAVDEAGNCIFDAKDIEALGNKSAAALEKVFTVAQRLSGLTKEDMDSLVKNSEDQDENSALD